MAKDKYEKHNFYDFTNLLLIFCSCILLSTWALELNSVQSV